MKFNKKNKCSWLHYYQSISILSNHVCNMNVIYFKIYFQLKGTSQMVKPGLEFHRTLYTKRSPNAVATTATLNHCVIWSFKRSSKSQTTSKKSTALNWMLSRVHASLVAGMAALLSHATPAKMIWDCIESFEWRLRYGKHKGRSDDLFSSIKFCRFCVLS